MTKKLEDILNLPNVKEAFAQADAKEKTKDQKNTVNGVTMLRNAIDAKGSKIDKKLKMVELQLKKLKIDKTGKDDGPIEESDGFVISDRNELMKKLLKKDNPEDSKKD